MKEHELDLIILAADKTMKLSLDAILGRPAALMIRPVKFKTHAHPHRDPGCRTKGAEFLQPFVAQAAHALLIFDREGCGSDQGREELERETEKDLERSGWGSRAAAVVIEPELETWVWSDSPHVAEALGWKGRRPSLKEWMMAKAFLRKETIKPPRPREAMESALREVKKPWSSSIHEEIALKVGLKKCQDQTFGRFTTILRAWFPAT